MTDDLRKRIAQAIFDPGQTQGYKGDRDLTTWQTDAVMAVLEKPTPNPISGGTDPYEIGRQIMERIAKIHPWKEHCVGDIAQAILNERMSSGKLPKSYTAPTQEMKTPPPPLKQQNVANTHEIVLREALKGLLLQALQSDLNSPSNEWGMEAIEKARTALYLPGGV